MAKKKSKSKKQFNNRPKYNLPTGFWQQVLAILFIVLSILLIFNWFNAGGPFLKVIQDGLMYVFGFGSFALPLILIYLGVEIFRSDGNKLSVLSYVAGLVLMVILSGLSGLTLNSDISTGGLVGDNLNQLALGLIVSQLAVFIYIVLIVLVMLFMIRVSPFVVLSSVKNFKALTKHDIADGFKPSKTGLDEKSAANFQLVEGVPTAHHSDSEDLSAKSVKLSNFRGSTPRQVSEEGKPALVSVQDPNWRMPSVDILGKKQSPADAGNVQRNAKIIQDTLSEFDIKAEMTGANIGPKVTQYTLMPPSGVKLSRIAALETNFAYNLAAQSLRIEAPIPGKRAVGIEVPNVKSADVNIRGILTSPVWTQSTDKLNFAIGRDITGEPVIEDLNDMPHLLIAGQTGSGKSVMINTLLVSLLYRNSPSDLKLILVDPKQVEMAPYADIPHLLTPVITEPTQTISALKWAINEMERRYSLLAEEKKKDILGYNDYIRSKNQAVSIEDEAGNIQRHQDGAMPYIVIVIDELSDLMMAASREVEVLIVRIAQKARAVGIHLVLATQRPSVDVVTGLIKANIPARIAFTVASQVDSKTILDRAGAEKLLGKGDMLMITAKMNKPRRIQGAWVSDEEVIKVADFLKDQMEPQYNDEVVSQEVHLNGRGGTVSDFSDSDDSLLQQSIQIVIDDRKASTTLLQRRLRIGYSRAARLMDELETRGVISAPDGSRPREVLITSIDDLI